MSREPCPVRRAINAFNKAQAVLWNAEEALRMRREHLVSLLKDYPVTTDDPAIRHHILYTERRELTAEERRRITAE